MWNKLSTKDFIEKSIKVHGEKYDYSISEYKNSKTKVDIICPKHGIFKVIPNYHLCGNKSGCNKCCDNGKLST